MPAYTDKHGNVVDINTSAPLPAAEALEANQYFEVLGYAATETSPVFYIYSRKSRSITALRAERIRKESVSTFAPAHFVQQLFPAAENTTAAVDALREAIVHTAFKRGVYSLDRLRGIGAWVDDGRIVLHAGDRLIVDGKTIEPAAFKSRYSYEARPPQRVALDRPLSADEGRSFHDLLDRLSWERPESSWLLAGWIFAAPVCGALAWRPHAWISGRSGSGKSWVMANIVRPAIGDIALHCQFASTEAGIRQHLLRDARPVMFDEADGENEASANRVQQVLGLMRQASSETGGKILKGSADGVAQCFDIRSMFLCASITAGVVQTSDEGRVSALALGSPRSKQEFSEIERLQSEIITHDFPERLLARSVACIAALRIGAATFIRVVEDLLGSRRFADQAGTLLAAAWCLRNDAPPTTEEAEALARDFAWQAEHIAAEEPDAVKCLRLICEWPLRAEGAEAIHTLTVAELALLAADYTAHEDVSGRQAQMALQRHGIMIDGSKANLLIASKHSEISNRLRRSPFAVGWGDVLRHLSPCGTLGNPRRFGPGVSSRTARVPLELLVDHQEPDATSG